MQRADLEHLIRAAGTITGANEIVIIGSQSILGQFPNAPKDLLESMEADVFTFRNSNDAVLLDGAIGELTTFHQTFGYYAHGVGMETARLPRNWRERLVRVCNENTNGVSGLCLEVHDICVSKIIAGREKDLAFVSCAIRNGLAKRETIKSRLEACDLNEAELEQVSFRLSRA